jgi:hypothetical protein
MGLTASALPVGTLAQSQKPLAFRLTDVTRAAGVQFRHNSGA